MTAGPCGQGQHSRPWPGKAPGRSRLGLVWAYMWRAGSRAQHGVRAGTDSESPAISSVSPRGQSDRASPASLGDLLWPTWPSAGVGQRGGGVGGWVSFVCQDTLSSTARPVTRKGPSCPGRRSHGLPCVKTIFISPSERWCFCVNPDMLSPQIPFQGWSHKPAELKKARCVWPDSWLHVRWKKPKINTASHDLCTICGHQAGASRGAGPAWPGTQHQSPDGRRGGGTQHALPGTSSTLVPGAGPRCCAPGPCTGTCALHHTTAQLRLHLPLLRQDQASSMAQLTPPDPRMRHLLGRRGHGRRTRQPWSSAHRLRALAAGGSPSGWGKDRTPSILLPWQDRLSTKC